MALTQEVIALFEVLVEEVGEQYATIHVSDIPTTPKPSLRVSLSPTNPGSAPIIILVSEGQEVFLTLGHDCRYEMPITRKRQELEILRDVGAVSRAVMAGEFEEEVWFRGDDVVAAKGRLKVGDKIEKFWTSAFKPFLRGAKHEVFNYQPYK